MNKKKLLLVEDDLNLGIVLKDFLEMEGFFVAQANDGRSGYNSFTHNKFDLAILDIMMPNVDGITLAQQIRNTDRQIPIIFLSAKSMKEDIIKGFKIGADDYITKPFSTEELVLRINAVLRRSVSSNESDENMVFKFGIFEFNSREFILKSPDKQLALTKREAGLLKMLCLYKNKLLRREIALKEIWGENDYFMGRSMDVYIAKLRKVLKADPQISILNIHNAGFKLIVDGEENNY
jgi:two-component system OmpR family response regulator